jgi:copper(I)-binding protein
MRTLALGLSVVALAAPALADVAAGELTIKQPMMRAVAPGVPNTAGYFVIANAGSKPEKLLSAACGCAKSVEIHISHVMNGMAMMMPSGPIDIPAGGEVRFGPGGRHLMVMGLKAPLADGGSQMLTLKFQHAGTVTVPFAVKATIPIAH